MKILVRQYSSETQSTNYVWKEMRKENPFICGSYHTADGETYNISDILQVAGDWRKNNKYVICSNCGKVIRKSALENHYLHQEANANCMKCDKMRLDMISGTQKNKLNADGVTVTVTYKAKGVCRNSYYNRRPINEVNRPETCKYYACRRSDTRQLPADMFSEFPNPYKNIITENAAISNGWKFLTFTNTNRNYANSDGKVIVSFDSNGIIIDYSLMMRGHSYDFTYSDVYDKFFDSDGREFDWKDISLPRINRYKKQIRALYAAN